MAIFGHHLAIFGHCMSGFGHPHSAKMNPASSNSRSPRLPALLFTVAVGLVPGCTSSSPSTDDTQAPTTGGATTSDAAADPQPRVVEFVPGRAYEVTALWVKDGKLDELGQFASEAFPIAMTDYGVRPLLALQPVSVSEGTPPDLMFINEWPSLAEFQGFVEDPRARALFPRRQAAVDDMTISVHQVSEPSSTTLFPEEMLDLTGVWLGPGDQTAYAEHDPKRAEIVARHGGDPVATLLPLHWAHGDFFPTLVRLDHWKTNAQRTAAAEELTRVLGNEVEGTQRFTFTTRVLP